MRLLDSILPVRSAAPVMSFDQWLQAFAFDGHTYPLSGLTQTLHGDREEISGDFVSLVVSAFMANTVVFACEVARVSAFSEARFQYQDMTGERPGALSNASSLAVLEEPWTGGVTGDLLARMLLYADFAGTSFAIRTRDDRTRIIVPRPDWVTMILGSDTGDPSTAADADLIGLLYHPGGRSGGGIPEVYVPGEFAIFAPTPDPLARFRGVPWPSVARREIMGDNAMSEHKQLFMANGATPNMVVTLDPAILQPEYEAWVAELKKQEPKGGRAYRTLYLGAGAKVDVVGVDLQKLEFKATQGAGETRIAAAAGVHPVIAGLSEGLAGSSLNAGNFSAAKRRFVDLTIRPLWRNMAGSLQSIVPPPPGSRLWYDDRDIAFLREDAKDRAEIAGVESQTIRTLLDAGYLPDSVTAAVLAEDWSLLRHSGLFSVQLQPPMPNGPAASDESGRALVTAIAALAARQDGGLDPEFRHALIASMAPREQTLRLADGAIRNDIHIEPTVVPAPEVTVRSPDIHIEPTVVPAPDVRVDGPVVTVAAPSVNVEAPNVTVQTPDTLRISEMPTRVTRRKVTKRTEKGAIAETMDVEEDES